MSSASEGVGLVTGAAQGIGRAIALQLADKFDVAVNDIPCNEQALNSLVAEITTKGRRSFALLADVSVEDQVKDMVSSVVTELGGLNVVRTVAPLHPSLH